MALPNDYEKALAAEIDFLDDIEDQFDALVRTLREHRNDLATELTKVRHQTTLKS